MTSTDDRTSSRLEANTLATASVQLKRRILAWTVGLGTMAVLLLFALIAVTGVLSLADGLGFGSVIVAVFFGVWALREGLRHEEHLGEVSADLLAVSGELSGVADSVLTRTLGGFPGFFRHVEPLLRRAQSSVRVMGDSPCYGIVSDGEAFDRYLSALKSCVAHEDITVELMYLDAAEREELHRDQMIRAGGKHDSVPDSSQSSSVETHWREQRDSNKSKFASFLGRAHRLCDPSDAPLADPLDTVSALTLDEYVQQVMDANESVFTRHLFGADRLVMRCRDKDGTTRVYINGPIIYFWMRDNKEAIFAIVPLSSAPEHPLAVAFSTVDPTLISALNGIYRRYASAATRVEDAAAVS